MKPTMTVEEVAERIGKNPQFIREMLKQERFPFGGAVKMPGGRWSYYINRTRFEKYMRGELAG